MKTKYIFVSLVAALGLAVGCQKEADHYLNEIKVSPTTVSLNPDGGSYTLTFTTSDVWELEKIYSVKTGEKDDNGKDIYTNVAFDTWMSGDKESGAAGENSLVITYEGADYGRTASIRIASAGKTQDVKFVQGLATTEEASCAEVIAGPDSQSYRIKGVCTRIVNTSYGNWYINDGTGEVYIYGTVNASGSYAWSSFNIEVGDVVTVEGPKTTYNGTVELVDATFISVEKSLVKIEEGETASFDAAGGSFKVRLTTKGNGPAVSIPEDAKSWVSISSIDMVADTTEVTFFVAESQQEAVRTASIGFTSVSGDASSTVYATVSQTGLIGTLTNPYTVAQAIEYCNTLSGESTSDFYVKGIVSSVLYTFSAQYGTGTFWISDDGTAHGVSADKKSTTAQDKDFEAYGVYWLGNNAWADGNAQVSVGDEVILHGKLTLYNGTSETSSKKAYVYSVNGLTTDAEGLGSLAYPLTVAGAIPYAGTTNLNVYIKGIVSSVLYTFTAQYGTGTFWISDDGTAYGVSADKKSTTAQDKDFEAYAVYYFGGNPWTDEDTQIAVGDEVILYGQTTVYNGTSETSSKKAWIYSHNGKTE